jgi:hypothetical protein
MSIKDLLLTSIFILLLCILHCVTSCTTSSECNNGVCRSSVCVCNSDYATFNNETCNYKRKEKLTAFLLSFLVGNLGADWFYLSQGKTAYIVAGVFKLLTGIFLYFGIVFIIVALCCLGSDRSKLRAIGAGLGIFISILCVLCVLCNVIWYTVDWIRILSDAFKDGNAVDLKSW